MASGLGGKGAGGARGVGWGRWVLEQGGKGGERTGGV